MLKQTRFYLGLTLIVQAVSCFFLVICFLFKDKKNTAGPFTILGLITAIGGTILVSEKIKERFDDNSIIEAMNDICDDNIVFSHDIPIDETADEAEFN
ncbi:MAG: hypothetical protein IJO00_02115 [Clostridia bacterium]|nr:hypothetical protein [Clostridia bacterium]